jgi:hypothetical protein
MHFLLNISTIVEGQNDKTAPDAGAVSGHFLSSQPWAIK